MKKIVFIINSLSNKSGTERVACNLANLFTEYQKIQIVILNRDTNFDNVAYSLNSNVKVECFDGNILKFYKGMNNYLNSYDPDYVIIHNMGRLSLLCSFLNKKNFKIISLEHVAFSIRPFLVRFFSKLCYKNIDTIVSLTCADKYNYKLWHKKVVCIPNFSSFPITNKKISDNKVIISVGRLTFQKNIHALLDAWEMVYYKIPDWNLNIYGSGEDFEALQDIIKIKKLKNIKLMGESNNIEKIYQNSSLFILSSRFEGFPMVLVEAQAFGLPIISFDCPHGPSEIIQHQKNGLLIRNYDVKGLADAILELALDTEKRRSYSSRALKDAKRFEVSSILKLWVELFED